VVLTGDVALSGCQVQSWDVVGTVSVLELDGSGTSCKSKQLVTKTDTHDRDLGRLHQSGQMVDGLLAVSGVTWSVGDENTVEVMSNLVDGEIIWEDSGTGTTADQTPQDVLLDTAVDNCNVHISMLRVNVERSLGADFLDQVNLLGINESFILIGIVFLSNGDSGQRRTLLSQVCDNSTGINARDGRYALTSTPIAQTLNGSPMTVFLRIVRNNNTNALDVWRLKVFQQTSFVSGRGGDAIVADERLGENENLSTVRRVGHRLRISNKRSRKDSLTRDIGLGAKRLAVENWSILHKKISQKFFLPRQNVSYPNCERSSVVRNRSCLGTSGWHSTASTALDGSQESGLLGNPGVDSTCGFESPRLHESSKHAV
jgi:hypothetical protein